MKPLILIAFVACVVYALGSMAGGCMNCLLFVGVAACVPTIMAGIKKGTGDM